MPTRAGSGITDFDGLMDDAVTRSPLHRLRKPEDVGRLTAFLISDWAASQTVSQMFVDAGHHIMA
jgi:enoyl-[acyl-carrier protein] reductase I